MTHLFVAVDGGNSKTDVVIGTASGSVLATVRGPGSSPHHLGVRGAIALIDSLILAARTLAELPSSAVLDRAEIYLAGADLPTEVEALDKAVGETGWAREHRVDNDTFALLRAGTDAPDAVAVVCGAGINCVGRTADGRTARFLSLGQISGDWGGGHHLGALALYHAARGEDGRGARTSLSAAVVEMFGRATVEEVSAALHLGEIAAERIHDLAPVLFAAAAAGDEVAARVVARQAREIVSLVRVAAGRLRLLEAAYGVVLGGSVLAARHPLLHDAVSTGIWAHSPHASISVVAQPPVIGAALLCLDALSAPAAAAAQLREALGG
ncbi:MAG TPA: BadF/BadG/BcrA/BcrD ATPase family protein [Micromonosporaceae bacterium]|nr:BadF/BadG/BcrA/BcrD ATPase family protein [Micromonosporaceae bacterium]